MTNNAEREGFRKSYGEVIKALADIVANAPQTDGQCEAELIPRPYVMDRVVRIREAMDALSKLWQARSQASGVPDGRSEVPPKLLASEAPDDHHQLARSVWEYMDRKASPGVTMQVAYLGVLHALRAAPKSASVPVERLEALQRMFEKTAPHLIQSQETCYQYAARQIAELIAELK